MSGVSLLSRLALRRGLTSSLRPLTSRVSSFTAPRLSTAPVAVSGLCERVRGLSTTSVPVRSVSSGGGVAKLKIAIIGQSMFGRDVSGIFFLYFINFSHVLVAIIRSSYIKITS